VGVKKISLREGESVYTGKSYAMVYSIEKRKIKRRLLRVSEVIRGLRSSAIGDLLRWLE